MLGLRLIRSAAAIGIAAATFATAGFAVSLFSSNRVSAAETTSFKTQVLPIFELHCIACHSPSGVAYKAINLDLTSYQGLMSGSNFGVAVIPYHPELSPLIQVLEKNMNSIKNLKMPPVQPLLPPAEIKVISDWIGQGAKDN